MRADRRLLSGLTVVAMTATLAPPPAAACGPDFPISLLLDRGETLATLPDGTFLLEVAHLVEPAPAYPYVSDAPRWELGPDGTDVRGASTVPVPDDAGSRERALYQAGDYAGVLALPPAARRHRSTWAAYMQGRNGVSEEAIRAYRRVRALVDDGYEDVGGLAASSLGQEARLHYQRDEWVEAVHLYAEQAAVGHPDGALSLLFVMRQLIADGAEAKILADPIGQRVAATYLATRSGELEPAQADRLWDELIAIDHLAGADQLAAAAYHRGAWDRAAALAAPADATPLRAWVQAKLALRDGDRAAADRLLAQAAEGYRVRDACPDRAPSSVASLSAPGDLATEDDDTDPRHDGLAEPWCGSVERIRIVGERATIAVADGRMAAALALTWDDRASHPDDLTYVAERLVTIDELRTFVDALPGDGDHDPDDWSMTSSALSALLGRRLMRAGRYALAVPYLGPDARGPAIDFALAMAAVDDARDRFARARALFQASRVARSDGLEILGTAHAPDWEFYGAQYDRFVYEEPSWLEGHTLTELALVAANAPSRPQRYHYRYLAADLAQQAADLLPHHTQAYVATLCWAARHLRNFDQGRVERLYARALRGTPSIYDMDFPNACPLPDFDRARQTPPPPPRRTAIQVMLGDGHHARRDAIALLALLAVGLLMPLGLALPRRRWRRFTPRP